MCICVFCTYDFVIIGHLIIFHLNSGFNYCFFFCLLWLYFFSLNSHCFSFRNAMINILWRHYISNKTFFSFNELSSGLKNHLLLNHFKKKKNRNLIRRVTFYFNIWHNVSIKILILNIKWVFFFNQIITFWLKIIRKENISINLNQVYFHRC